jgi:tetratricopeptide (TPR) repeat protein
MKQAGPNRMRQAAFFGFIIAAFCMHGAGLTGSSFAGESTPPGPVLSGGISQDTYALSDDIDAAEAQVKANPDDPEAHFLLAIAYSRTPYVEKALEEMERSRRLARKTQEGYAMFDRKIREYEHLLSQQPDDPLVLYRLGFGYYMRGYAVANGYMPNTGKLSSDVFYDKAEQTFRHLVAIAPDDVAAKNYLGYLLAERAPEKNYDAAVALWQDVLRQDPENPGAYMLLGQAALKKGNLRQAVAYSAHALKARNAWLEAHNINPATVKVRL